ncbi:MAG: SH3 domain-containing protein, partial [Mesorhizobium sp.]
AAALAVASTVLAFVGQSHATAFAAWQVSDLPFGDTLNARKYPSGSSQKQAAYPNGTVLQLTGRCTGGINLL